jgi:hypothetical protein
MIRPLPARVLPVPPDSASTELAELRHELDNERRNEVMAAHRRARIHMAWLAVGGLASVVLLIWHMYLASCGATGAAPLLAEVTVMLRRIT